MPIADDPRLGAGVERLRHGDYFAAHEVWEALWNDAVGNDRDFVRALVHVAAACMKLGAAEGKGTRRLLTRAGDQLAVFPDCYAGLDVVAIRAMIEAIMRRSS